MKLLRSANGLMTVLFALFAFWQQNDPDPELWVTLYGLAAAVCLLFAFRKLPRWTPAVLGVLAFGMTLYLATRVIGQQPIFDEEGREMMGALIVGLWMGLLYFRGYRSTP